MWKRLLREPLVHFIAIGLVLFVGMTALKAAHRPTVRLDAAEIEQLANYWAAQAGRQPTAQELKAIIDERVNDELLAREALRLGLDKDDLIIRRRLAQKMAFASEDAAPVREPSRAQLERYFRDHAERYATPGKVSFRHIFISGDRKAEDAHREVLKALEVLRSNEGEPHGDPFLLPLAYSDVAPRDLERDYGPDVVKAAQTAPVGEWVGPVASPYGLHLIRVEARQPPQPPSFDSVRDLVREDLLADARKAANARYLDRLRQRYRVVVSGAPN